MNTKTASLIFTKVVSGDKSARMLANVARLNKQAMQKKAGPIGETVASLAYTGVPYLSAVNDVGGIAGMVSDPATEKEEAEWDKKDLHNLLPAVGMYRINRRLKRQLKSDKGGTPHYWSQGLGGITASLLAAGAGAGIGAGVGALGGSQSGRTADGAGFGAGIGALGGLSAAAVANLVGAIKAAVDRRRTKEEQKAYANSPTTKEWLLPGVGAYNSWKTVGRSIGDAEERKVKKDKKESKDEEKA